MEKSLWIWGPLYQSSINLASQEYAKTLVEQHIAVDGGILARTNIATKEKWTSIGDGDSCDDDLDIQYPEDKNQSDLALALEYSRHHTKANLIRAFGFSGERLDHHFIGLACFKRHLDTLKGTQARIDGHCLMLSPGQWKGHLKASTVSLLTLEETQLSLSGGWKWQLKDKHCKILDDLLLSNECNEDELTLNSSKSIILWSQEPIEAWWKFYE